MKKILSTLLTLSMLLSLMPTATWAADETPNNPETIITTQPTLATDDEQDNQPEPGQTPNQEGDLGTDEVTTPTEETNATTTPEPENTVIEASQAIEMTVSDIESPYDDNELFTDYVDYILYGGSSDDWQPFSINRPAGDQLKTDRQKQLYAALKEQIVNIDTVENASRSTIFKMVPKTLPIKENGTIEWTAKDLSDAGFDVTGTPSEAFERIQKTLTSDAKIVLKALLIDCPYELYWFDKTTGAGMEVPGGSVSEADKKLDTLYMNQAPTITFHVAKAYQDSNNTTVKNVSSILTTVKNNAKAIVDVSYANDLARLEGYRTAIRSLVEYNTNAADDSTNTPYGDPWQLINVFDHQATAAKKKVVCEGYAKAFQYLCDLTESQKKWTHTVESFIVTGTLTGTSSDGVVGTGGHMWNIVQVDDESYLVDVTNSHNDENTTSGAFELFMVGAGSAQQPAASPSYTFVTPGAGTVTFAYDDDSAIWGDILTLSTKAKYEENSKTLASLTIEPTATTTENTLPVPTADEATNPTLTFTVTAAYTGEPTTTEDVTNNAEWTLPAEIKGVTIEKGVLTVSKEAIGNNFIDNSLTFTITATFGGKKATADVKLTRTDPKPKTVTFYKNNKALTGNSDTISIPSEDSGSTNVVYTVKAIDQYGQEMKDITITATTNPPSATGMTATISGSSATINVLHTAVNDTAITLAVNDNTTTTLTITAKEIKIPWPTLNTAVNYTYGDPTENLFTAWNPSGTITVDDKEYTGTFVIAEGKKLEVDNSEQIIIVNFTTSIGTFTQKYKAPTVNPKAITVNFGTPTIEYGASLDGIYANPQITPALVEGDTQASLGLKPSLTTTDGTAVEGEPTPGTYNITATKTNNNYNITIKGTLTVNQAQITPVAAPVAIDAIYASNTANTVDGLKNYVLTQYNGKKIQGTSVTGKTTTLSATGCELASGAWNAKGGSYTYTLTLAPADNNFEVKGTATATVTVNAVNATLAFADSEKTLTKKASDLKDITDISAVGLPATVGVTYSDKTTDPTGTTYALDWSGRLQTIKDAVNAVVTSQTDKKITLTPALATDAAPDWATVGTIPSLKLTITAKTPLTLKWQKDPETSIVYGTTLTTPIATAPNGPETLTADDFKYIWQGTGSTTYNNETAPTNAGTYRVTATLVSEEYSGSISSDVTITPLAATLTWEGTENLVYDGTAKTVTAKVSNLVGEDTCTVTVTSGSNTNAGTYTATATALSNSNYALPKDPTAKYTIAQAERNLSFDSDKMLLTPAALSQSVTVTYDDEDKSAVLVPTMTGTVAAVTRTGNTFTAVGNGHVAVAYNIAETDNYKAATEITLNIHAFAQPITGFEVTAKVTDDKMDPAANLIATLSDDGKTIVVRGTKSDTATVIVTPILADTALKSEQKDAQLTISTTDNETIATYTIDLTTAITELGDDVELKPVSKEETENQMPEGDTNKEVADKAVNDENTTVTGILAAAAEMFDKAVESFAKGIDVPENVEAKFIVETKVAISAKSLEITTAESSFKVNITPKYIIKAVAKNDETQVIGKPTEPVEIKSFAVPVTVSVKLPDGFLTTTNVFARHFMDGGKTEILPVTVDPKTRIATWQQSSFSDVELFTSKTATVTFNFEKDNRTETIVYNATHIGQALPTDSRKGHTFNGWTIGDNVYKTVTEELLALSKDGAALNATPSFTKNADPTPDNPDTPGTNPGGNQGGSSGGDYGGDYGYDYDGSGESSSSSGTASSGNTTTTTDSRTGTVTTTTANTDGSRVVTVTQRDGATATITTNTTGQSTAAVRLPQVAVSTAQKNDTAITLPLPQTAVAHSIASATAITVTTGSKSAVKVEIPTTAPTPGTVAVLVKADGSQEIIKTSVPTANGIIAPITDGATIKIIDNSKSFTDVGNHWSKDAIAFVSARQLFAGTGETTFSPDAPMTRAMLMTVLARFDGADTAGGNIWYEKGMAWAVANHISDGTNPEANITREQLVAMLWRYAGNPATSEQALAFTDAASVSDYAVAPMQWAVENHIIGGMGDGVLAPQSPATRGQVAQILQNFIAL